jgi:hypothetical protein
MDKRITVRFYRVDRRSVDSPRFVTCLERLMGMPEADRPREVGDAVIQMMRLGRDKNLLWGDLVRLQIDNLPSLVERGGTASILELPQGKALGHHTAFLYDPEIRMLAYQLTRDTVSMSRFNLYVSEICECHTFSFVPVLKPSELRQLNQMNPKTFYVKIADPLDLEAVEDTQLQLRDNLAHLKDLSNGTYVKLVVGLGRRRGELDRGYIRAIISWLLEQRAKNRGKVRTLKVEGTDAEDEHVPSLDFLKAHVGESEVLDLVNAPDENFEARLDFLKRRRVANEGILRQFVTEEK